MHTPTPTLVLPWTSTPTLLKLWPPTPFQDLNCTPRVSQVVKYQQALPPRPHNQFQAQSHPQSHPQPHPRSPLPPLNLVQLPLTTLNVVDKVLVLRTFDCRLQNLNHVKSRMDWTHRLCCPLHLHCFQRLCKSLRISDVYSTHLADFLYSTANVSKLGSPECPEKMDRKSLWCTIIGCLT